MRLTVSTITISSLLLCDGGGSNSASQYLFKADLQRLADELGLEIRVAHYPPYASKVWTPRAGEGGVTMTTLMFYLSIIALVSVSLFVMSTIPVYGEGPSRTLLMNASYHRTQAATYRQEAVQLGHAIRRYEIMAHVYQHGK